MPRNSESNDDESATSTCVNCSNSASFMCSSCGLRGPRYCSLECQKTHWKAGHYKVCEATEAARRSRRTISNAEADRNTNNDINRSHSITRGYSRFGTAQLINERRKTSQIPDSHNGEIPLTDFNPPSEQHHEDDESSEDFADELKFYTQQIYLVIKPVVVCIVLSIFWVKVAFSGQSDYSPSRPAYSVLSSNTSSDSNGQYGSGSGSPAVLNSFTNAAIIIAQIIVVTVIIVFLFRKGWIKLFLVYHTCQIDPDWVFYDRCLIVAWLYDLPIITASSVFSIPLDYITLVFALWNFTVVGLVSIFWKGPLWLQQCYLTVMSSLMAFAMTGLEQWTTWILLGLLAIWGKVKAKVRPWVISKNE
ncbi:Presenilin-1 [Apophysomyces ossiformis]|uniref:Presenilin-1 n=1 Tax=Apophysomyces ossiformis TaxID=679940 RepID=A0A8H7EK16_9FUNG|nr:Presenilin-1 [Apophysomyces ossiformis]